MYEFDFQYAEFFGNLCRSKIFNIRHGFVPCVTNIYTYYIQLIKVIYDMMYIKVYHIRVRLVLPLYPIVVMGTEGDVVKLGEMNAWDQNIPNQVVFCNKGCYETRYQIMK